ncbi:MAG TPA: MgtC/SapB family protein [Verrucomicrobiae bacterium]
MNELLIILKPIALSLALGLLVGLQRERTNATLAGFRTFPLITLAGAMSALLAAEFGGWIVAMGFVVIGAMVVVGNLAEMKKPHPDTGVTTETAMLVMYCVGAYLVVGSAMVGVIVGGVVAVLLHLKPEMKRFAGKIGDEDFKAIMQFVVISMIILPVLPNEYYGPYSVLNPFKLWLMVVFIVGLSLTGYVIYKFFGEKAGTLTGGILGGLISSTATTVSYARRTKESPNTASLAAVVLMIASAIVFIRVLLLIVTTAPAFFREAVGPISALLVITIVLAGVAWFKGRDGKSKMPEQKNPSELKAALVFGAMYGLVLLGVAAAKENFGERGLYAVAILSGLTDMDAITLSVSQMVQQQHVDGRTGWRLVIVAALSNLVFKTGIVAVLGNPALLGRVAMLFGGAFIGGLVIIFAWPG